MNLDRYHNYGEERYYTLNQYLQKRFGQKVYKLALDGGMTCPNRDGTLGYGGCIFCSQGGSGEFASVSRGGSGEFASGSQGGSGEFASVSQGGSGEFASVSRGGLEKFASGNQMAVRDTIAWIAWDTEQGAVADQIERAKMRIQKKTEASLFIAYFQSYTNTYASVEYLRRIFMEAILHPQVAVLSIATRPDCLPPDVMDLLSELNRIKPVWVELGLQTIHEHTAKYIRRGYELSCYEDAVKKLHAAGIEVITHVILGLPGESREEILSTVRYLSQKVFIQDDPAEKMSGQVSFIKNEMDGNGTGNRFRYMTQGIKLQLLHVLKGTDLAGEYQKGAFSVLSQEEYMDILFECLENLPPDMVVHRITGDGPKSLLIAPQWSANKKAVLNTIRREMKSRDIIQGRRYADSIGEKRRL